MSALSLATGVSKLRGSVLQGKGVLYLPTYHPAFLLRGMQKEIPTFIADLAKAKTLSGRTYVPPKEDFNLSPTLGDVEDFVKRACKKSSLIAVDIETTGLRPDASEIFVVGLADSGEHAISIPFFEKDYKPYWHNGDLREARKLLARLLATCPTIYQNALFDVMHLRYHGFEVLHVEHDVLLAHHAIHPELPHNLGYIVSVYGQTPFWKDTVAMRDGRLGSLDNDVLRTYNLRDAVVLHQVLPGLLEDLDTTGTAHIYKNISMPLVNVICAMQLKGIALDQDALRKWKRKLTRELEKSETSLRESFHLPDGFMLSSGDHLRLLLYGHLAPQFVKASEALANYDKPKPKRHDTKKYTELVSTVHVAQATKTLWCPSNVKTTASGKLSTDEEALLRLQIAANNRLQLIEKFSRKDKYTDERKLLVKTLDFIEGFRSFQETSKLLSTYSSFPVWSDGRVHSNFRIHGTKTGRLASSEPNAQNLPKSARHLFVADAGCILLEADYSNLELRVLAYLADDRPMIETFAKGENIHDQNTKDLFGIDEEDATWPLARRAAKIFVFGRNYGGGLRGIFERVSKEVPSLGLTYSRFCEVDLAYRKAHPAYASWASRTRDQSLRDRFVCNAFGRKRILLGTDEEIQREGLNTPIQGTAADIINTAMIRLSKDFECLDPPASILVQVHDSLLCMAKASQKKKVVSLLRERMQATYRIGEYDVEFPIEITSGATWGSLK